MSVAVEHLLDGKQLTAVADHSRHRSRAPHLSRPAASTRPPAASASSSPRARLRGRVPPLVLGGHSSQVPHRVPHAISKRSNNHHRPKVRKHAGTSKSPSAINDPPGITTGVAFPRAIGPTASARRTIIQPAHRRLPGRRQHGRALVHTTPDSPAVAARTKQPSCSASWRAGAGASSGRSRK